MADIDTGKVERFWLLKERRTLSGGLLQGEPTEFVQATDFDRLSRDLAEAKEQRDRAIQERAANAHCSIENMQLRQQLAESERLAAARNQLNGELAMENEKLREVLRALKVRIAYIGHPAEAMWTPHDKSVPDWRTEIALLEAALTAPATPKVAQPAPAFTHDAEGRN